MTYHALSVADTMARLETCADGLSDAEASVRLARFGPNTIRAAPPEASWKIFARQFRSIVVILLVVATVVAAITGDSLEAGTIGAVLAINTLVGFVAELRARRAMEALMAFDVSRAVVVRTNRAREIDAHTLVPGDVIALEPGQHVPADARLITATDLQVDEAALSGESLPTIKQAESLSADTALPDRSNMVYKGTSVVAGVGRAAIVATGMETEIGRIGRLTRSIRAERTPLERRLDTLGHRLLWIALSVAAAVALVGVLRGAATAALIETGLALAIAAVPEGLPAVATIALAIGMRRMAHSNALVRRLPAVETLGSVTVICSDKTGTLTAGEMTVTALALPGRHIEIAGAGYTPRGGFSESGQPVDPLADPQLRLALHIAALANRADVQLGEDGWVVRGDPTEAALLVASRKAGLEREALLARHPEAGEVPFSSERMFMATFHHVAGAGLVAHLKGAPVRVLERCHSILDNDATRVLDEAARRDIMSQNDALASRGLRVIALASGPATGTDDAALQRLSFVGLAGMIDAPAAGVKETLGRLHEAGVRTVMITGDQRRTAEAVAADLGILRPGEEVLDGSELARIPAGDLARRAPRVAAFSRVSPEDKLAIVNAFQANGEIVAMLGDGVNDAPALRKADVGVGMGMRGTDVAREASDVVLQDDRFSTIAIAVEQGRVIFDNIRKFVFYLFSCNLAEVLVLLGAGIVGWTQPLLPIHILWLNLVTDTFPALALAAEPAEGDVMRRAPRDPQEALLSRSFVGAIGAYAALITVVTLTAFALGAARDGSAGPRAVTMSFATLGIAQGLHLGNARRRSAVLTPDSILANRWAIAAVVLVLSLQLVAVQSPLGHVLHTVPLSGTEWLLVVSLAALPAVLGQVVKRHATKTAVDLP